MLTCNYDLISGGLAEDINGMSQSLGKKKADESWSRNGVKLE